MSRLLEHSMGVYCRAILLSFLLLLPICGYSILGTPSILVNIAYSEHDEEAEPESGDADENETESRNWSATLPIWNVGDQWEFSVVLDAVSMVEETAELEDAELDFLYGNALMQVQSIVELDVVGVTTPAYRVYTTGTFVGEGRNFPAPVLGTVDGRLNVAYHLTEYHRVSDLALISYEKRLVFTFTAVVSFVEQTVDISDSTEYSTYVPPREFYDFPLALNESWNVVNNHTSTYVGSGGLVSIPDEPEYYEEERRLIVERIVEAPFAGCENSSEVWMYDASDEPEEWRKWCPAVNMYAYRWTDNIALGDVNATMTLTAYSPASPAIDIQVNIEPNRSALNGDVQVLVNITDGSGSPISGSSGYLYLGSTRILFNTGENGTDSLSINVGNEMDDTPTADDWATHGVVAVLLSDQVVGVSTLTLEGSSIGGVLRLQATQQAAIATAVMYHLGSQFELAVRY